MGNCGLMGRISQHKCAVNVGKRKPHKIKHNKTTALPRYFLFFDTETTEQDVGNGERKQVLRLGWVVRVYRDKRENKLRERWCEFRTVKEFWDFVEESVIEKGKLWCFAHNLDFDFRVLQGFKVLKERGWKIETFIYDSKNIILSFRKDGKTLLFLDTFNYFKGSVKKMGEAVGLPKLEVDFTTVSDEELSRYCKRDVEIIKEFMMRLVEFVEKENLGTLQKTLASQAFTAFRHRFMKHGIYIHNNIEVIELERESYRGGRTEAFYIGRLPKGRYYKLDVNSMYPFVMRERLYPTKLIRLETQPSLSGLKRALQRFFVIAHVRVRVDKPVIAIKGERLIFPVGEFDAFLTSPEIELVMKHGEILKVYKYAIYEQHPIFKDYVDFFYTLKEKYAKEGNSAFKQIAKLFLNSLYGKFGQRTRLFDKVGECEHEDGYEVVFDAETGKRITYRYLNNEVWVESEEYVEGENSMVAIASTVTAYARCYLWELIEKAGLENVFYCDTDSLIVNEEGYERLRDMLDDYKLGYLKCEGVSEFVEIRNAKDYTFGEEVKRKGVKKDAVEIAPNTFKQIQFERLRTAWRKGRVNEVIVKEQVKELKQEYQKGIVTESGRVIPFRLS